LLWNVNESCNSARYGGQVIAPLASLAVRLISTNTFPAHTELSSRHISRKTPLLPRTFSRPIFAHCLASQSRIATKPCALRLAVSEHETKATFGRVGSNFKTRSPYNSWSSYLMSTLCSFFLWRCGPTRAMASAFLRFLDHTQRRNIVGWTPLDE
jgi:hypothetical protein